MGADLVVKVESDSTRYLNGNSEDMSVSIMVPVNFKFTPENIKLDKDALFHLAEHFKKGDVFSVSGKFFGFVDVSDCSQYKFQVQGLDALCEHNIACHNYSSGIS